MLGEILVGSFFKGAWFPTATGGQAGISVHRKHQQFTTTRPEQTSSLGSRKVRISTSHSISPPFRASFLSYSSRLGPTTGGRKTQAFLGELGNHHKGLVDTSGGVRNEDLILVSATSVLPLRSSPPSQGKDQDVALEEEILEEEIWSLK